MRRMRIIFALAAVLVLVLGSLAYAQWSYEPAIKGHVGGDATPTEALRMVLKDKEHTFIVDVRTRPEYDFLGHPTMALHVPLKFWTGKMGPKGYALEDNPNFAKDLLARFNPKTDTLIFMCRSGHRSCLAAEAATKAGWPADKVFNMLGGFEGDKIKCELSIYDGKRVLGGWKNEGLPWTYHLDPKLVYDTMPAK